MTRLAAIARVFAWPQPRHLAWAAIVAGFATVPLAVMAARFADLPPPTTRNLSHLLSYAALVGVVLSTAIRLDENSALRGYVEGVDRRDQEGIEPYHFSQFGRLEWTTWRRRARSAVVQWYCVATLAGFPLAGLLVP